MCEENIHDHIVTPLHVMYIPTTRSHHHCDGQRYGDMANGTRPGMHTRMMRSSQTVDEVVTNGGPSVDNTGVPSTDTLVATRKEICDRTRLYAYRVNRELYCRSSFVIFATFRDVVLMRWMMADGSVSPRNTRSNE